MAAEAGFFLLFTFFQMAGLSLLTPHALRERRGPIPPLVILLALNAGLTAISTYEEVAGAAPATRRLFQALDAPSGVLLWAAVAANADRRRLASSLLLVGASLTAVALLWPTFFVPPARPPHALAIVYHSGLAALVWAFSRGDSTRRWLALAFAPRGLFFGAMMLLSWPPAEWSNGGAIAILASAVIILAALPRLLQQGSGPPASTVIALFGVGPLDAMALRLVLSPVSLPALFLNYVTLALVRPLFMYIAVAPDAVGMIIARSMLAAGIGTSVLVVGEPLLGLEPAAAAVLAISLGSLTLVAAEALAARRLLDDLAPGGGGEAGADLRPHWQRLVLALRGSSVSVAGSAARPEWTQKLLAARVGVSVQRVSEFGRSINKGTEARLDLHAPGWRALSRSAGAPRIVEVHKGLVQEQGIRTYYRLTTVGEYLAAKLEASPDAEG